MGRRFKKLTTVLLAVIMILVQFSTVYGSNQSNEENTRQAYVKELIDLEKLKMGSTASLGENTDLENTSLSDESESDANKKSKNKNIVPGKMIVKYKSTVSGSQKSAMNAKVSALSSVTDKRLGITELKLSKDADVLKEVEKLKNESEVEYAEPVYVRKALSVVESVYCTDEFYANGFQWGLQAIAMDDMWSTVDEDQLSDIVIAVIDSGVDVDHSEFTGKIVPGYDFINNDSDPDDDYGHGTHVAGIAAALHDGAGIAGVAGGAGIMPLKALDDNGSGDTVSIVNSILYAVNNGANVINMSLGSESYSYAEAEAVKYAIERGVTVVAAAGNTYGGSALYPAAYDGVISVGAVDWNSDSESFELADFSADGDEIDLAAPGVDILSTIPEELDTLSNFVVAGMGDTEKNGYSLKDGTSMAAPFVAGMAALILASNQGFDCDQVLDEMKVNAGNIGVYNNVVINGDNEGDINAPLSYHQLSLDMDYGNIEGEKIFTLIAGEYRDTVSESVYGDFDLMMGKYVYNGDTISWVTEPSVVDSFSLQEKTTASIILSDAGNYIFYVPGANGLQGSNKIDVFTDLNDSFSDAVPVEIGTEVAESLDSPGDADYYKFTVNEAGVYTIESTGSLDTYGYLYNENNLITSIDSDDDNGSSYNFLMEGTLASGTYYVKIVGFSDYELGDYGLKLTKGSTATAQVIAGTVVLPQGVANENLNVTVNLFHKSWSTLYEEYVYQRIGHQEKTIVQNTSSANYSFPVQDTGYVVEYRLENTDTNYVQVGYYGISGTCVSINSANEVGENTTNANLTLISKDSISDEESNTLENPDEFGSGAQSGGTIDYADDIDCYKLSVETDGNYIIGTKYDSNILSMTIYFSMHLYDENRNFILTTGGSFRYSDGDYGRNISAHLTAGKNYYLVIESIEDNYWLSSSYPFDLFSPFAYSFNISRASLISGTVSIPDDITTPNLETADYDNTVMVYVDFPANNSSGIRSSGSYTNIYEGETSSGIYNIHVPSSAGYLLSYYLLSGPDEEKYLEEGYYDGDTGGTVSGAENAGPVDMTNDKEVNFTILPIGAQIDPEGSSKETAATIQIGDIITGYLNYSDDEDYFKFHVDQAGYYTIQDLYGIDSRNVGFYLYDNSDWIEYAETNDSAITRYLIAGDYYLKFRGNNSYGYYEFSLFLDSPTAPTANSVTISGTTKVGSTLTGSYIYNDANGDVQSGTTYRWLRSDTAEGIYSAISDATGVTYKLTTSDLDKFIKFEVTPKAEYEPKAGASALSPAVGSITAAPIGGGGGGSIEEPVNPGTIDVNPDDLDSMLIAPGTSPVIINARTTTDEEKLKVNIPSSIFTSTAKSGKPLVIETNNVSFIIEPGTLNITDSDAMVSLEVSRLSLDDVPEAARNMDAAANEVSMVFDFDMFIGDDKVTEFGKPVTITVKFDAAKVTDSGKVGVYYYNETDGKWEYVGGHVNEDGTVTFTVEHFSKYAVMEYKKTFADITTHWAKSDIELMTAKHITTGVSDSAFAPNNTITRAEFAAMLSRALGLKTGSNAVFEDIPSNAWYKEAVSKAHAAGIISGTGNMTFAPGEMVTREQMAAMLMNAYSYITGKSLDSIVTTMQVRFKDEASASSWARRFIILANATGLMNGSPDGTFGPKGNATRAEAVVTIKRLLEKLDML